MSHPAQPTRRTGRLALLLSIAALAAVAIALTVAGGPARSNERASAPPPEPARAPHFVDVAAPGAPRVLVIAPASETLPGTSNPAGLLMANMRAGSLPAGAASATVLTDSNCEPDADGISHCINDLNVGGTAVTVQHHHNMAQVPCLSPGETVTLMTLDAYRSQL